VTILKINFQLAVKKMFHASIVLAKDHWRLSCLSKIKLCVPNCHKNGGLSFHQFKGEKMVERTLALSFIHPRPPTVILVKVSCWRRCREVPRGPRSRPTKLNYAEKEQNCKSHQPHSNHPRFARTGTQSLPRVHFRPHGIQTNQEELVPSDTPCEESWRARASWSECPDSGQPASRDPGVRSSPDLFLRTNQDTHESQVDRFQENPGYNMAAQRGADTGVFIVFEHWERERDE
jgi:hypothetical protein